MYNTRKSAIRIRTTGIIHAGLISISIACIVSVNIINHLIFYTINNSHMTFSTTFKNNDIASLWNIISFNNCVFGVFFSSIRQSLYKSGDFRHLVGFPAPTTVFSQFNQTGRKAGEPESQIPRATTRVCSTPIALLKMP